MPRRIRVGNAPHTSEQSIMDRSGSIWCSVATTACQRWLWVGRTRCQIGARHYWVTRSSMSRKTNLRRNYPYDATERLTCSAKKRCYRKDSFEWSWMVLIQLKGLKCSNTTASWICDLLWSRHWGRTSFFHADALGTSGSSHPQCYRFLTFILFSWWGHFFFKDVTIWIQIWDPKKRLFVGTLGYNSWISLFVGPGHPCRVHTRT